MNSVPSVDLNDFLSKDPVKKQKFVSEIGDAFEQIGFVALKGHFLDDELKDELYTVVKSFFSLDEETKKQYEIEGGGGQRGYTSFGKETAKGETRADLKEFWHFGQINDPKGEYPKNIKVSEISNFNSCGEKVFDRLEQTAKEVLRALALHLNLDEFYFDDWVIGGNSILRALHYPPVREEQQKSIRAAAHGDINLITLLMGAHGKGLQVKNNKDEWIDAIAEKDELMINVGDMLSRLTNNKLKSTIHRVVNPNSQIVNKSRYSIPFFMHPKLHMPLNCLENCVDDSNPKQFEDCTAGEFLTERLIELGLIKK